MSITLQALERLTTARPNEVADAAFLQRLSALPEDRILDYFWLMVRQTDDHLGVLLQLTAVVVVRPADWDYAAVRRDHEQQRPRWSMGEIDRHRCFGCESTARLYFHHILEVQHGGSNASRNLVPLCFRCHQYLHPWLTDEPARTRVSGFESLWEIGKRVARVVSGR